jgi:hypothetical protein
MVAGIPPEFNDDSAFVSYYSIGPAGSTVGIGSLPLFEGERSKIMGWVAWK